MRGPQRWVAGAALIYSPGLWSGWTIQKRETDLHRARAEALAQERLNSIGRAGRSSAELAPPRRRER